LLPDGISLTELKQSHSSHPRNPNITKVFYRRGLIEEMGMGTQEIIKICANANMKEPEFFEQAGTFVVRLWSRSMMAHAHDQPAKSVDLSDRHQKILGLLKKRALSPNEILSELDEVITDRTLRRDLQFLKDSGYIDAEGTAGWSRKWFTIKNYP